MYLYEAGLIIQGLTKIGNGYIDDVLSLNNSTFSEYLDIIYPRKRKIKETRR